MLKNFLTIYSFLLITQMGFGQIMKKQTMLSSGSSHFVNANNKSYFIQESIGQQSVIFTYNTSNYSLRQGFLQPISPNALNGGEDNVLRGFLYPNPFVDEVHIRFQEPIISEIQLYVYDELGRVLHHKKVNAQQEINIRLLGLSNGNYYVLAQMRHQKFLAKLIKI